MSSEKEVLNSICRLRMPGSYVRMNKLILDPQMLEVTKNKMISSPEHKNINDTSFDMSDFNFNKEGEDKVDEFKMEECPSENHNLSEDENLHCPKCLKEFKEKNCLSTHLQHPEVHNRPFLCSLESCNRTFSQVAHLLNHRRVVHPPHPSQSHSCPRCLLLFSFIDLLSKHLQLHNCGRNQAPPVYKAKSFSCPECPKSFSREDWLQLHLDLHRGSSVVSGGVVCAVSGCGQRFGSEYKLHQHLSSHMRPPEKEGTTCRNCNQVFSSRLETLLHRVICEQGDGRSKVSPAPCSNCKRQIKTERLLAIHLKTCQLKKTVMSKDLSCVIRGGAGHVQNKGEKLTCDDCGKMFNSRAILKNHQYSHVEHPLHCSEKDCNASFVLVSSFQKHWREYHGRSRMPHLTQCPHCDNQFINQEQLAEHLEDFHTETSIDLSILNEKNCMETSPDNSMVIIDEKIFLDPNVRNFNRQLQPEDEESEMEEEDFNMVPEQIVDNSSSIITDIELPKITEVSPIYLPEIKLTMGDPSDEELEQSTNDESVFFQGSDTNITTSKPATLSNNVPEQLVEEYLVIIPEAEITNAISEISSKAESELFVTNVIPKQVLEDINNSTSNTTNDVTEAVDDTDNLFALQLSNVHTDEDFPITLGGQEKENSNILDTDDETHNILESKESLILEEISINKSDNQCSILSNRDEEVRPIIDNSRVETLHKKTISQPPLATSSSLISANIDSNFTSSSEQLATTEVIVVETEIVEVETEIVEVETEIVELESEAVEVEAVEVKSEVNEVDSEVMEVDNDYVEVDNDVVKVDNDVVKVDNYAVEVEDGVVENNCLKVDKDIGEDDNHVVDVDNDVEVVENDVEGVENDVVEDENYVVESDNDVVGVETEVCTAGDKTNLTVNDCDAPCQPDGEVLVGILNHADIMERKDITKDELSTVATRRNELCRSVFDQLGKEAPSFGKFAEVFGITANSIQNTVVPDLLEPIENTPSLCRGLAIDLLELTQQQGIDVSLLVDFMSELTPSNQIQDICGPETGGKLVLKLSKWRVQASRFRAKYATLPDYLNKYLLEIVNPF